MLSNGTICRVKNKYRNTNEALVRIIACSKHGRQLLYLAVYIYTLQDSYPFHGQFLRYELDIIYDPSVLSEFLC